MAEKTIENIFHLLDDYEPAFRMAIERWGEQAQRLMTIEECSELITVLAQRRRGRADDAHECEEIADALIMLTQMLLVNDIDTIYNEMEFKLDRLARLLAK